MRGVRILHSLRPARMALLIGLVAAGMAAPAAGESSGDAKPSGARVDRPDTLFDSGTLFPPMHVTTPLYPRNDACGEAKLDIWLNRGMLSYSLFSPRTGAVRVISGTDGATILIGEGDCVVRVRIERAVHQRDD